MNQSAKTSSDRQKHETCPSCLPSSCSLLGSAVCRKHLHLCVLDACVLVTPVIVSVTCQAILSLWANRQMVSNLKPLSSCTSCRSLAGMLLDVSLASSSLMLDHCHCSYCSEGSCWWHYFHCEEPPQLLPTLGGRQFVKYISIA